MTSSVILPLHKTDGGVAVEAFLHFITRPWGTRVTFSFKWQIISMWFLLQSILNTAAIRYFYFHSMASSHKRIFVTYVPDINNNIQTPPYAPHRPRKAFEFVFKSPAHPARPHAIPSSEGTTGLRLVLIDLFPNAAFFNLACFWICITVFCVLTFFCSELRSYD